MKTLRYLLALAGIFMVILLVDSYKINEPEPATEDFLSQRRDDRNAAELRAEQYRAFYRICDEDHNCTYQQYPRKDSISRNEDKDKALQPLAPPFAW